MQIALQSRRAIQRPRAVEGEGLERHIRIDELPSPHIPVQPVLLRGFVPEAPSVDELQLAQKMFFLSGKEVPRVLVFCGVEAQDGAEMVCARMAEVLSCLVNESVCLMDANLREPSLHVRYEIDASYRFRGSEQEVTDKGERSHRSNLWVMPAAGLRECRPGFAPGIVRDRLEQLRAKFGFLLICTPPLSTAAEGYLLAQLAEGVVLTVMAWSTQRAAALKVRRNLELYDVPLLGVVMNKQRGKGK